LATDKQLIFFYFYSFRSLLPAQESAKHSQTLFKSLYRGSTKLLERKDWGNLRNVCLIMVSTETSDDDNSTVPLALSATAKLASHVPEPHSLHLLSKVIVNCPAILASISTLEGRKENSKNQTAPLEILTAALGAGNSLRKRVATLIHVPTEAIIDALGGEDPSLEIMAALNIAASIVGVGFNSAAPSSSFADYAHSAAVALACSARIQGAGMNKGIVEGWGDGYSLAAERVLGWRWPTASSSPAPPTTQGLLSSQELVWLSSSLYNVGIDLLTRGVMVEASIVPLTTSLMASIAALSMAFSTPSAPQQQEQNSNEDESEDSTSVAAATRNQAVHDVVKRASVLIEALAKSKREASVLTSTTADVFAVVSTTCPEIFLPSSTYALTLVNSLVSATVKQQVYASALNICPPTVTKRGGSRKTKTTVAPALVAGAATSTGQSLTAAVQTHPTAQISEDIVAMLARAELIAWAEALSSGLPPTAGAETAAAAAAQHLLDAVYPVDAAPLDHARILLLVETLHLDAFLDDKTQKKTCIERAQHVLRPLVKKGDDEALILDALMAAQGVLREAQTLVEASIDHQKILKQEKMERIKRNPSAVHADEPNNQGEASNTATAAAVFVVSQAAKWSCVLEKAKEAITKLSSIAESSSASSSSALYEQEDGKALFATARELSTLVGIFGLVDLERQALNAILLLEGGSCSIGNTGCVLQECLLPAFDTCAVDGAALEAAAADMAVSVTTSSRDPATVMQRAELSIDASLAYASSGAVVKALYCVGEGHRLLGSLIQASEDGGASGVANPATCSTCSFIASTGWWKLSVKYCRSLLLVGRLFNSAGMMDEGINALKEGQKMAEAMGSSLLTAAFTSQLAQIYAICGQPGIATTFIQSSKKGLELYSTLSSSLSSVEPSWSIVDNWIVASVACAETCVHSAAGEYTQAMLCCHTALDSLEEADQQEDSIKPHIDTLLAAVHCARLDVLKSEARGVEEIGTAAKEALNQVDADACIAFGAAPRARLLLTLASTAAVEDVLEKLSSAAARLWVPCATAAEENSLSQQAIYLWQALLSSRGAPHVHRFAAFKLAPLVAAAGHVHLAALLLHIGAGSTLQLQHQLVLHARECNAQRRQRAFASTLVGAGQKEAEIAEVAAVRALHVLDSDLDWELIQTSLATLDECIVPNKSSKQAITVKRGGSKRNTAKSSPSSAAGALVTLNTQAEQTLHKWISGLPPNTPVCTVGAHETQDCLVVSRLSLVPSISKFDSEIEQMVVVPVILDIPIKPYGTSSSQHPIRALALDASEDNGKKSPSAAVASAVHEMDRVLEDSTRSMKNMATETRDQQREWWRTRVELDDSLAALLQHLGEEWLGPWKCFFIGPPASVEVENVLRERAAAVVQHLLGTDVAAEDSGSSREVVNELAVALVHSMQSMSAAEQRQAASTFCTALLEVAGGEKMASIFCEEALKLLTKASSAVIAAASSASSSLPAGMPPATMVKKTSKKAARAPPPTSRKVTFFQDDEVSSPPPPPDMSSSPEPRTQLRQAPSFNTTGIDNNNFDDVNGSNLCARFEALAVEKGAIDPMATPLPLRTPGAATIRAKKHKSRLALMQGAVTPAAKSSRQPLRPYVDQDDEATSSKMNIAATAPRMPRPLATPATAAFTMPVRARTLSSSSGGAAPLNAAPVVAIFSPELQSLPWESTPGLVSQQIYRLHALPCAAAAAASASPASGQPNNNTQRAVDLSSAYYTINPSGDLQTTQDTFETWFKGLPGWSGRAGSPPSSSELAHALQSKELFVYCGHGGGEQYIPTAKLRGLPRCAASLLMGCSSGRLRGGGKQQYYYEPTGVVLAYLLAGCPTAVANLWDVTDRDIDRFAQAVLMKWLGSSSSTSYKDGDVAAAVGQARGACKLPCLIGAAPVCYGVPTNVSLAPNK
jgi:hypothetical protein